MDAIEECVGAKIGYNQREKWRQYFHYRPARDTLTVRSVVVSSWTVENIPARNESIKHTRPNVENVEISHSLSLRCFLAFGIKLAHPRTPHLSLPLSLSRRINAVFPPPSKKQFIRVIPRIVRIEKISPRLNLPRAPVLFPCARKEE